MCLELQSTAGVIILARFPHSSPSGIHFWLPPAPPSVPRDKILLLSELAHPFSLPWVTPALLSPHTEPCTTQLLQALLSRLIPWQSETWHLVHTPSNSIFLLLRLSLLTLNYSSEKPSNLSKTTQPVGDPNFAKSRLEFVPLDPNCLSLSGHLHKMGWEP